MEDRCGPKGSSKNEAHSQGHREPHRAEGRKVQNKGSPASCRESMLSFLTLVYVFVKGAVKAPQTELLKQQTSIAS